jgi:hypothetical protein
MIIKRKIIPIVHTNKSFYVSKLIRQPYYDNTLLKPRNYINPTMLNTLLYTDIDNWYLDTYPMYLEYLSLRIPEDVNIHFQKWDFYAWNIKVTNPYFEPTSNEFFIGDITRLAYYTTGQNKF